MYRFLPFCLSSLYYCNDGKSIEGIEALTRALRSPSFKLATWMAENGEMRQEKKKKRTVRWCLNDDRMGCPRRLFCCLVKTMEQGERQTKTTTHIVVYLSRPPTPWQLSIIQHTDTRIHNRRRRRKKKVLVATNVTYLPPVPSLGLCKHGHGHCNIIASNNNTKESSK